MTPSESGEFFEAMYANADGDDSAIPWQDAISRRFFADWLASLEPADHDRALVVAAGLGDDAAAVADLGLDVVAFDHAPSAVEWARQRHPGASVDWQVADLLSPPDRWTGAFDLVVEVFTIQSIQPTNQATAAAAVRNFVGQGGTLIAVALVDRSANAAQGPPWPLDDGTFGLLGEGFDETLRHEEDLDVGLSCVLTELKRRVT